MKNLLMISGSRAIVTGKPCALLSTLEGLSKHFERIDVLCPKPSYPGPFVRQIFGNVYLHPGSLPLLLHPLFILRKGKELLKACGHHLVTVHEYPPFYNGLGARLLHWSTGVPVILEIHHIVGFPKAASFAEWFGKTLTRLFISMHSRFAASIRVVNDGTKEILASWGVSPEKIVVVPSVYLDRTFSQAVRATSKAVDVVFAGRLEPNKGVLPVIDAVASLPGVTMRIIGDGSMRGNAEARVKKLQAQDRITFAGWLSSSQETAKAIASGRLLVMNSLSEGNPRVALEALSYGVPVIATRVGIMPEVIQEGVSGYFSDGTAKDVAEKIKKALAGDWKEIQKTSNNILDRFESRKTLLNYASFLGL